MTAKSLKKAASAIAKIADLKAYVRNRRSNIWHRLPTRERCNVDQVPRSQREYADRIPRGARRCGHCL